MYHLLHWGPRFFLLPKKRRLFPLVISAILHSLTTDDILSNHFLITFLNYFLFNGSFFEKIAPDFSQLRM